MPASLIRCNGTPFDDSSQMAVSTSKANEKDGMPIDAVFPTNRCLLIRSGEQTASASPETLLSLVDASSVGRPTVIRYVRATRALFKENEPGAGTSSSKC